jgi:hypothetical protein
MSAKKNILLLISYTYYKSMSDSISTNQSLSPFSVGAFTFLTLTANIPILFTAIPQHAIISLVSSALDIQHFLKPFTVTPGEKCCHAVMIHNE